MTDEEKIKQWTPLVNKIAHKYSGATANTCVDFDDLFSVGQMAVLEAYQKHDPEKGALTTVMHSLVTFRILNEITDNGKFTRGMRNWILRLKKAYRELGPDATDEQIIAWSDKIHKHQATKLTKNNIEYYKSLMNMQHVGFSIENEHFLIGEESEIEDKVDYNLKKELVLKYLNIMKPNEKTIILGRMAGDTLDDLGIKLHLTRERIRQIEQIAMQKLKDYVSGKKIPVNELEKYKTPIEQTRTFDKFTTIKYEYFKEDLDMIYNCEFKLAPVAFKVLQYLKRNPGVSNTKIADAINHSLKSVYDHFKTLVRLNIVSKDKKVLAKSEWSIGKNEIEVKPKPIITEPVKTSGLSEMLNDFKPKPTNKIDLKQLKSEIKRELKLEILQELKPKEKVIKPAPIKKEPAKIVPIENTVINNNTTKLQTKLGYTFTIIEDIGYGYEVEDHNGFRQTIKYKEVDRLW